MLFRSEEAEEKSLHATQRWLSLQSEKFSVPAPKVENI